LRFPLTRLAGDGADVRFEVLVPPDSAFFEGHFPGAPVLPGVAQLGVVLEALAVARGAPSRLLAIRRLRFRHTVVPRDRLTLSLEGNGPVRFRLTRGTLCVSEGLLDLA
jgi:3-hydroxymyristoyl/3-hydroxydecanoyl-(acyl carrier protein) dehydratase